MSSHFSIDSKYSDLVHVWELRNDQHKHGQCVKKEHRMLIVCCVRGYQIQDNRYNSQKLSVTSELLAIVYLLPPSQPVVDTLVFSKWCSLLPMKELIRNQEVEEVDDGPGHAG